jgi:hypothetical protein
MKQPDELLALFADYNPAIWPLQVVAYVAAAAVLVLIVVRPSRTTDRLVVGFLAALWLFIGVVFQGIYVRDIDETLSVAYAAIFLAQAVLLVGMGIIGARLVFRVERTPAAIIAAAAIAYSLVVYPLLGVAFGHPWPEAPLFGAAPCPTTILTFGLFLLVRPPFPKVLLVVPLIWAVLATPAAVGRGVYEDVALLAVGVLATAVLIWRDRGTRWVGHRLLPATQGK